MHIGNTKLINPTNELMNHPLTDEMCEEIGFTCRWSDDGGEIVFSHFDMRRAADWQLEQVKKIVERKVQDMYRRGYEGMCVDLVYRADAIEEFFEDIMQEMRPQEDN